MGLVHHLQDQVDYNILTLMMSTPISINLNLVMARYLIKIIILMFLAFSLVVMPFLFMLPLSLIYQS